MPTTSSGKISRTLEMAPLPAGFVPGPSQVICAKGSRVKKHAANQLLRSLVQEHLKEYSECPSKLERSFIVSKILKFIRNGGKGGFVRLINGKYYDVGDRNAREKIGQAFRDQLSHMFRSSTRAKAVGRRSRSTNHSPIVPVFPISEVSFSGGIPPMSLPRQISVGEVGSATAVSDLEPLPLSNAIPVDLNLSQVTPVSEESSFHEAMDEMYQSHFSSSSEDTFAFSN